MKEFEYIGVMASIVAYLLIVNGVLSVGFAIGVVASLSLAFYFVTVDSPASVSLQLFFICANIYGLVKIGAI
jgi:energy-converting hydrogenase Eha subunit G